LAVGAYLEASLATGVGGNQNDNLAFGAGAVYVFTRSGSTWSQQAYIKASNTEAGDYFGTVVSLSSDGSTLAVGANQEASSATGVGGDQTDDTAPGAGAVYMFARSGSTWSQQAYVKASNTGEGDRFGGLSVTLSGDGLVLAVGALFESSGATGIDGDQTSNLAESAGAAYVFTRSGTTWSQQAYVKASNTGIGDQFGYRVALSDNGGALAVGAIGEASSAAGIGGDQSDNTVMGAGAVYLFARSGTTWSQQRYLKASNTGPDAFGSSAALSGDASTLAVGAFGESSSATGIDGNQGNNSAPGAGAVYTFR
jgi:FG-GAP repeat